MIEYQCPHCKEQNRVAGFLMDSIDSKERRNQTYKPQEISCGFCGKKFTPPQPIRDKNDRH